MHTSQRTYSAQYIYILAYRSNHEVQQKGVFPLLEFAVLFLYDRKGILFICNVYVYHKYMSYLYVFKGCVPPSAASQNCKTPFAQRFADWTAHSVTASNCCLAEAVSDLRQNQHAQHV